MVHHCYPDKCFNIGHGRVCALRDSSMSRQPRGHMDSNGSMARARTAKTSKASSGRRYIYRCLVFGSL